MPSGEFPEARKGIRGLEYLCYGGWELGLLNLDKKSLQAEFIAAFQYLEEAWKKDGDKLLDN